MEKEIWKDIKGYEGCYQVSNLGRIKSLPRFVRDRYRTYMLKERILKDQINNGGYHFIELHIDRKYKFFLVHRLVFETFKGEIPEGYEVNHINEDKSDNRLSNLNILTSKQNVNWGTRNERAGIKHRRKVVMDDNIEFDSIKKAAEYLGCSKGNVSMCCRKITKTACGHTFRYK